MGEITVKFLIASIAAFSILSANANEILKEVPLPWGMKTVLTECLKAERLVSQLLLSKDMLAACVSYRALSFEGKSRDQVLAAISRDHRPTLASSNEAADLIRKSVSLQIQTLKSVRELSDKDLANMIDGKVTPVTLAKARSALRAFEDALNKQIRQVYALTRGYESRGSMILQDANTYWAPSVNARAAFVLDVKASRVLEFLHGDLEG
jgi:hypothetical protein